MIEHICINQEKAIEHDLNMDQAVVMSVLSVFCTCSDDFIEIGGEIYKSVPSEWVAINLPLLKGKNNYVKKIYEKLHSINLIEYIVVDNQDYIIFTQKGCEYGFTS